MVTISVFLGGLLSFSICCLSRLFLVTALLLFQSRLLERLTDQPDDIPAFGDEEVRFISFTFPIA